MSNVNCAVDHYRRQTNDSVYHGNMNAMPTSTPASSYNTCTPIDNYRGLAVQEREYIFFHIQLCFVVCVCVCLYLTIEHVVWFCVCLSFFNRNTVNSTNSEFGFTYTPPRPTAVDYVSQSSDGHYTQLKSHYQMQQQPSPQEHHLQQSPQYNNNHQSPHYNIQLHRQMQHTRLMSTLAPSPRNYFTSSAEAATAAAQPQQSQLQAYYPTVPNKSIPSQQTPPQYFPSPQPHFPAQSVPSSTNTSDVGKAISDILDSQTAFFQHEFANSTQQLDNGEFFFFYVATNRPIFQVLRVFKCLDFFYFQTPDCHRAVQLDATWINFSRSIHTAAIKPKP